MTRRIREESKENRKSYPDFNAAVCSTIKGASNRARKTGSVRAAMRRISLGCGGGALVMRH